MNPSEIPSTESRGLTVRPLRQSGHQIRNAPPQFSEIALAAFVLGFLQTSKGSFEPRAVGVGLNEQRGP